MKQETHTAINWLERHQIVSLLESYGFQCYDSESDDELRDVIRPNIETGVISTDDLLIYG